MEDTLVRRDLLVGLLGVDLVDGLGGDGGGVQVDGAEGSRGALAGLLLGNLVVLNGRRAGGPGGAENLVGLAVQVSEMGGGRVGREEKDGFLDVDQYLKGVLGNSRRVASAYLESLLGLGATTEAGLVTTGGENQPVLFLGTRGQDGLPVVHGNRGDALLGDLLGELLDGSHGSGSRHVGLDLVEPSLHAVGERDLLLGHGQGREEGDERRETHLEDCRGLVHVLGVFADGTVISLHHGRWKSSNAYIRQKGAMATIGIDTGEEEEGRGVRRQVVERQLA